MGSKSFEVRLGMNRGTGKILYMEAGKDFVDVLLAFLQLPLASILKLLSSPASESAGAVEVAGVLGNASRIYESVGKMSQSSMEVNRASLTNPPFALNMHLNLSNPLYSLLPKLPSELQEIFKCSSSTCTSPALCYERERSRHCESCHYWQMSCPVPRDSGYVKPTLSFIITDDLSILRNSATEIFTLLHTSAAHAAPISLTDLHTIDCSITTDEALKMLRYFFSSSRSVLNDIFGSKVPPEK